MVSEYNKKHAGKESRKKAQYLEYFREKLDQASFLLT